MSVYKDAYLYLSTVMNNVEDFDTMEEFWLSLSGEDKVAFARLENLCRGFIDTLENSRDDCDD